MDPGQCSVACDTQMLSRTHMEVVGGAAHRGQTPSAPIHAVPAPAADPQGSHCWVSMRAPIWLIGKLSPNSIIRFNVLPSYLWSVSVMIALVLEIGGISCIAMHRVGALILERFNRLSLCFIGPSGPQKVLESLGRLRHGCRGRPLGIQRLS